MYEVVEVAGTEMDGLVLQSKPFLTLEEAIAHMDELVEQLTVVYGERVSCVLAETYCLHCEGRTSSRLVYLRMSQRWMNIDIPAVRDQLRRRLSMGIMESQRKDNVKPARDAAAHARDAAARRNGRNPGEAEEFPIEAGTHSEP